MASACLLVRSIGLSGLASESNRGWISSEFQETQQALLHSWPRPQITSVACQAQVGREYYAGASLSTETERSASPKKKPGRRRKAAAATTSELLSSDSAEYGVGSSVSSSKSITEIAAALDAAYYRETGEEWNGDIQEESHSHIHEVGNILDKVNDRVEYESPSSLADVSRMRKERSVSSKSATKAAPLLKTKSTQQTPLNRRADKADQAQAQSMGAGNEIGVLGERVPSGNVGSDIHRVSRNITVKPGSRLRRKRVGRDEQQRPAVASAAASCVKMLEENNIFTSAVELKELMVNYGPTSVGYHNWSPQKRLKLLTKEDEVELFLLMKPGQDILKRKDLLEKELGRKAEAQEIARACGLPLAVTDWTLLLHAAARNKLLQHNLGLITSVANKYANDVPGLHLHDLYQEGMKGLARGIDKFDLDRGCRLSTYCMWWIQGVITRYISHAGYSVVIPAYIGEKKLSIAVARGRLRAQLGRQATVEEIERDLRMPQGTYRAVMAVSRMHRSLNESYVSENVREEFVCGVTEFNPDTAGEFPNAKDFEQDLDTMMMKMKPRERTALIQRFGLDGQGERNLREVGSHIGVSREMARRYEMGALAVIRQPACVEKLRGYLADASSRKLKLML
eukprot:jgi/Mesen1/6574/ME000336S05796